MSEIINNRLRENIGKTILIFLNNGFRFEGKVTNCDREYLEILDYKTNNYKIIILSDIKEMEVKNDTH